MDRPLLEILSPVFNDPSVEQAVKSYVEHRLKQLYKDLEAREDHYNIAKLQGRIAELRSLLDVRQRVNDKVKELRT